MTDPPTWFRYCYLCVCGWRFIFIQGGAKQSLAGATTNAFSFNITQCDFLEPQKYINVPFSMLEQWNQVIGSTPNSNLFFFFTFLDFLKYLKPYHSIGLRKISALSSPLVATVSAVNSHDVSACQYSTKVARH